MKLYMIRHGESTANAEGKHAGWGQIPLTDKGRDDARHAGTLLEGVTFDRVYVSDLLTTNEHTDTPVRVFAVGKGAEYFSGKTVDNTDISKFIAAAIEGK